MSSYDFDLLTIGAGSGGVRASRWAAQLGAKAAVVEEKQLGGTCVNLGCVPKKLFSCAAHFPEEFADAVGFGWEGAAPTFNWQTLLTNKNREISRLNQVYLQLLQNSGVQLLEGHATVVAPHTVAIGDRQVTAKHLLIATGSKPVLPVIPGIEHAFTSNEAFHLPTLPQRLMVVGGGYIAVEFASIFNGLGVDVTLVIRGRHPLRGFDPDIGTMLAEEMEKKGVHIIHDASVAEIERQGEHLEARLTIGRSHLVDGIMFATGRAPNTDRLGLEGVGVRLNSEGGVVVNHQFQSSVPSIYAIGDVSNRVPLTPMATAEGMALANHLFADQPVRLDYANVPTAVFSNPNVGTVGQTEEEARRHCSDVKVFRSTFRPLRHTLSSNQERTFMKLVVDGETDRVLGIHMVGADAGEIIQGFAVALKCGLTKALLDSTIGIHPTSAEEFVTMRHAD